MGKCVSKHPSVLTVALSDKDLAAATAANEIWSKFAESTEYLALKDGQGNQLCEYFYYVGKENGVSQQQQQQQRLRQQNDTTRDNKSGQWTAGTIDDDGDDDDDNANALVLATSTSTANTNGYAYRYGSTINDHENEYDDCNDNGDNDASANDYDVDVAVQQLAWHLANNVGNITVDTHNHKNGQHSLGHLSSQRQQQFENAANAENVADSNNNASMKASNAVAKTDKNHKHHKNKENKAKKLQNKFKLTKWQTESANQNEMPSHRLDGDSERLPGGPLQQPSIACVECSGRNSFDANRDEMLQCTDYRTFEGQTESKKNAKKHGTAGIIETKGTAMSFGFRKKLNTTPKKLKKFIEGETKKKHDKCNNVSTNEGGEGDEGGVADVEGHKMGTVIDTENKAAMRQADSDNGNADAMTKVHFEKVGAAAVGAKVAQENPQEQVPASRTGVGNRFGYRGGNAVRPASTGLTSRYANDARDNAENNNWNANDNGPAKGLVSNLKRRSKSAHAGRALTSEQNEADATAGRAAQPPKITQPKSITFNLSQNSTIEYQRRQFFQQPPPSGVSGRTAWPAHQPTQQQQQQPQPQPQHPRNLINTGMHTNAIVRPIARTAAVDSYTKFTLHTVSLPRPEYPVAISLSATTPSTPGSTIASPITTLAMASSSGTRSKETVSNSNGQHQHQHPLTVAQTQHVDQKTAKQMANNTRRGFTGSREISADSGIASMDMAMDSSTSSGNGARHASPKRSRSRPRNLQMVMSGRHKFEVRDIDDPLSSESSSFVETLALPKLPAEHQTTQLPLSGLVRSNTVLCRESLERSKHEQQQNENGKPKPKALQTSISRNPSEESESIDEEKLFLDRSTSEKSAKHHQFKEINTCSSKTSSPGSSIMLSWCNAGESLAVKDCSSLSISSSEDSNKLQEKYKEEKNALELNEEDVSLINTDMQVSTISSITTTLPPPAPRVTPPKMDESTEKMQVDHVDGDAVVKPDRPKSLYNSLNETKFAEMALAGSTYLLDDETSPTDSLVSSTESEDAACKQKKHKINEELQEKDIDEISPELEVGSPISPGTPTHASHSLSLSDCGNLIDDEIADQPALLFNNDAQECSLASRKDKTDTPTLMETGSMRSLKSQSKARSALQQAIELSLRTPLSLRKAVMERAESLDTLSPCESICSDDLMMDFDMNSSMDSIDRSGSIKSRSGSDLNKIEEMELFTELENRGSDVMKELNSILRIHAKERKADKESVIAHLPARATRLLNRSRLQQQCPLNNVDSDSSRSAHSIRRSAAASRASTASTSNASPLQRSKYPHNQLQQHHQQQQHHRESFSSSDDLMLYDKSFRNAMIQDVLQFKKQLLRLRRILQEDEDSLMRTETLNPFENDNGQLFASCGLDSKLLDDIDLASLTSSTTDDPIQELTDLRRQVVYLQGQVDDRDRTIRLQRNLIEKLEADKPDLSSVVGTKTEIAKECINTATQTERTRPLSIASEGLSRMTTTPNWQNVINFQSICNGYFWLQRRLFHNFTNQIHNLLTHTQEITSRVLEKLMRFKIVRLAYGHLIEFRNVFGGIVITCLDTFLVLRYMNLSPYSFTVGWPDLHNLCLQTNLSQNVVNLHQRACNILMGISNRYRSIIIVNPHFSSLPWSRRIFRSTRDAIEMNLFYFFHFILR